MSRIYDDIRRALADPGRFPATARFEAEGKLAGYLVDPAMNLVQGLMLDDIRADMEGGDGNELKQKFRAPHSSSALAVNTFARFRKEGAEVTLGDCGLARVIGFEQKRHHGLSSERAPNLDMVATGHGGIIAVESKFMEYLKPKTAKFSPMYADEMPAARRGAWYRHMLELMADPHRYRRLDAAQLIKHAYGMAHSHPDQAITLLYLFWEPANADRHRLFEEHRQEIERFGSRIADDRIRFAALSYPELWQAWDRQSVPSWLAEHIAGLRRRYAVTIPV